MAPHTHPSETISTVLVRAPEANAAPDAAGLELLAASEPEAENVLAVTYDRSAEQFLRRWRDRVGERPANMRIVTVGEPMRSAAPSGAGSAEELRRSAVSSVERPDDLAALRWTVGEFLAEWSRRPRRTVVYVDSLTTVFEHARDRDATALVEWFADRLRTAGAVGYFRVDASALDDETLDALDPLFDSVVEPTADGWTTASAAPDPHLTLGDDAVFDLLSDSRRRYAIYHLRRSGPTSLRALAARIAAWESGTAAAAVTVDERRRVSTALYHTHIPKLAALDVVDYDADRDVIAPSDGIDAVEPYLRVTADHELEDADSFR